MGMDVYGKKPSNTKGEYFRNNIWWWRPLWRYCATVAPELCAKVQNPQMNDGDGLGAKDSKKLAAILRAELDSGKTLKFSKDYAKNQKEALKQWCKATGKKTNKSKAISDAYEVTGTAADYPFSVENVTEFVDFLEVCGGFRIC